MPTPSSKFTQHLKPAQGLATVALLAASGLTACLAQANDPPSADLQTCRVLADGKARLICYDALADLSAKQPKAQAPKAAPLTTGLAAAEAAVTTSAAAPVADTFGLSQRSKNEPEVISSRIDGLFQGWRPNQIIDLSNGQAWQVVDGSSAVLYLKSPKIEIRKAAMGTFMLELEGSNETARVKRIR